MNIKIMFRILKAFVLRIRFGLLHPNSLKNLSFREKVRLLFSEYVVD
jgi:hypothetical protein